MTEPTAPELQARLTSYELGMQEIADALVAGTMDAASAHFNLTALLEATGAEHVRALRHLDELNAAVVAFKTMVLQQTIDGLTFCPLCGSDLPDHHVNCLVVAALGLQTSDVREEKSTRAALQTLQLHISELLKS